MKDGRATGRVLRVLDDAPAFLEWCVCANLTHPTNDAPAFWVGTCFFGFEEPEDGPAVGAERHGSNGHGVPVMKERPSVGMKAIAYTRWVCSFRSRTGLPVMLLQQVDAPGDPLGDRPGDSPGRPRDKCYPSVERHGFSPFLRRGRARYSDD